MNNDNKSKKRILILDQNEALVEMMVFTMVDEGHEALGMSSASDFMLALKDYNPDLLLIEQDKASLEAILDHPPIPRIVLSVYDCEHLDDTFIKKPFALSKLTHKVEKLLNAKLSVSSD